MGTDAFLQITITDLVQAFSSVASVGVAVWAIVVALGAKREGRAVATELTSASNADANGMLSPQSRVIWEVEPGGKHSRIIKNVGSVAAGVSAINDVTPGGSSAFTLIEELPKDVPVNGVMIADISRSIADPYVSRIEIVWTESGTEYRQTYSVT